MEGDFTQNRAGGQSALGNFGMLGDAQLKDEGLVRQRLPPNESTRLQAGATPAAVEP